MKIIFITLLILIFYLKISEGQRTAFEEFLPQFRLLKDIALTALTPNSKNPRNLRLADDLHVMNFNFIANTIKLRMMPGNN